MKKTFDRMAGDKGYVTIDDYVKNASNISSMKKVAVSLFHYFDKKGQGYI